STRLLRLDNGSVAQTQDYRKRYRRLAGRDRLFSTIIVEPAACLAAQPTRFHKFYKQRARPGLAVGEPLVEHLHDRQAGVEPDEIGELEWTHRVIGAELHRRVDRLDRTYPLVKRVDRLVDHRQQDPVDDEGREILGGDRCFAELN